MALSQAAADALAASYKRFEVAGGRLSLPEVSILAAQEYLDARITLQEAVAQAESEAGEG